MAGQVWGREWVGEWGRCRGVDVEKADVCVCEGEWATRRAPEMWSEPSCWLCVCVVVCRCQRVEWSPPGREPSTVTVLLDGAHTEQVGRDDDGSGDGGAPSALN